MRHRETRPEHTPQSYWVRKEQVGQVKALAEREGVSASLLVREAIDDMLEREATEAATVKAG